MYNKIKQIEIMKERKLTPEQFYAITFNSDYEIIKDLKNVALYNFETMMQFAELYSNYSDNFDKKDI